MTMGNPFTKKLFYIRCSIQWRSSPLDSFNILLSSIPWQQQAGDSLLASSFFSRSLYLLAITGIKWFGAMTPIGGISFLFGWSYLIWILAKTHLT
jgi:uncharacterized membrane protein YgdD (TMEM256/DUF423 family)